MAKSLPPLPANAPGRNKFKYREQFGVVVICRDEAEHEMVYEQLKRSFPRVKAVRV